MQKLPVLTLPKGNNGKPGCCIRCGKKLRKNDYVSLELDQRVDEYHDFGGIPDSHNQGGFEFGKDCAKALRIRASRKLLAAGLVTVDRVNVVGNVASGKGSDGINYEAFSALCPAIKELAAEVRAKLEKRSRD